MPSWLIVREPSSRTCMRGLSPVWSDSTCVSTLAPTFPPRLGAMAEIDGPRRASVVGPMFAIEARRN